MAFDRLRETDLRVFGPGAVLFPSLPLRPEVPSRSSNLAKAKLVNFSKSLSLDSLVADRRMAEAEYQPLRHVAAEAAV